MLALNDDFKYLIKQNFGLDFTTQNEDLLFGAIDIRMEQLNLNSRAAYLTHITDNEKELCELICLLTNNETYFFREASQIEFLTDFLIPHIKATHPQQTPIRILSLGCSTGAEPYSIAIALQKKFPETAAQDFTIIGADVDNTALILARQARYGSMDFRGVSQEIQTRFFYPEKSIADTQLPPNLIVKPEIRERVKFYSTNIISKKIRPELTAMDIIFFRNVAIYFDKATRFSIQKNVITMLAPQGYLLVGLTESLSNNFGLLRLKQQGDIFYFAKGDKAEQPNKLTQPFPQRYVLPKTTLPPVSSNRATPSVIKKRPPTPKTLTPIRANDQQSISKLIKNKNYREALQLLARSSETSEHLLLHAFILFNQQDFEAASQLSNKALRINALSMDAFLLLGMLAKWQAHTSDAIQWFKKALYMEPNCWLAHYYLFGLYRDIGHLPKAQQECRLVIQQLNQPDEDLLNRLILPLSIVKTEIQIICQAYLKKDNRLNKEVYHGT